MNRRQLLKASGGIAAAGITGLAGCSGALGGSGIDLSDGSDWLPDPALVSSDSDNYFVSMTSPAEVDDVSDNLDSGDWERYRDNYVDQEFTNLVASEVDLVITTSVFIVLEGDIDPDSIESNLRDEDGISRETEHKGYELYSNDTSGYAVGDGAYIATSSEDPEDVLRQVIDASEGDVDLYTDVNEDLSELFDAVPGGHVVSGSAYDLGDGRFDEDVAFGESTDIGEEESDETQAFVFVDDIDGGTERSLEDYLDESSQFDDYREGPSLDISDNIATIEGVRRTSDINL